MKITSKNHEGFRDTGKAMHYMVKEYYRDLKSLLSASLGDFFNFVRSIPYEDDQTVLNTQSEILVRPKYVLDKTVKKIDCKKKSILIASYLFGRGIPYRFLAVSEKPDGVVHHVFPQAKMGSAWINLDATFPSFTIGMPKHCTYAEVI